MKKQKKSKEKREKTESHKKGETKKQNSPVKQEKKIRVSTGIKKFDNLIQGGFLKNSTNLLVGRSGSGKSIFAVQFLIEGIKKGENCLFISFEEKREDFFGHMKSLGLNLEDLERKGKFFFLEYTPSKVRVMLDEGGGAIESIVLKNKVQRIVLDSVSSLMLLFEKDLEKKEAMFFLSNLTKSWNCTTLLTYEENLSLERDTSRILDLETDSIILFYFLREAHKRGRFFEILKMRGTSHSLDLHHFRIENNGIIVH